MRHRLKRALFGILGNSVLVGAFRCLNRGKLLVVMYHGITEMEHNPPLWTQLPAGIFRKHLEYLCRYYRIVTLADVVADLRGEKPLPERAALVTFDDGVRNNFTVAFPILVRMGIPATIFLTVDYIGTPEILWFDELYLLLRAASQGKSSLQLPEGEARRLFVSGRVGEAYESLVETLKHAGNASRTNIINDLRDSLPAPLGCSREDFGMLSWGDVIAMHRSGLVQYGVHTATHRILSEMSADEWPAEIVAPKQKLEEKLQSRIEAFCFPNGRPGVDFRQEHLEFLRNAGYCCAFSTEGTLFDRDCADPMAIGRIAAGNDYSSCPTCFRLSTSGALQFARQILER